VGESGVTEPPDVIQQYIGTNPFDWIGDETSLGLGTAMYDLIGQAVSVPVYKLFGQRYRAWVSVGSWTVSTNPDQMAETVEHYACQGYTWMKYHICHLLKTQLTRQKLWRRLLRQDLRSTTT